MAHSVLHTFLNYSCRSSIVRQIFWNVKPTDFIASTYSCQCNPFEMTMCCINLSNVTPYLMIQHGETWRAGKEAANGSASRMILHKYPYLLCKVSILQSNPNLLLDTENSEDAILVSSKVSIVWCSPCHHCNWLKVY